MAKLSVVIPFVNEYPQVLFTIQSVIQELQGLVDFEVIAINNYCEEVEKQGTKEDKGYEAVLACEKINPELKVLHYKNKLSHWQAKNLGVQESTGDFLWFCDAHCMISRRSLFKMFQYYKAYHEEINGSIHLPLTYKLLETRKLIYKLVYNPDIGEIHYSFTSYKNPEFLPAETFGHYQMPCMSTCGMMITKDLYNQLGGWPKELGIYGGGENFSNFTLAVLGKTVNIFCGKPLFHHGEKRGYSYYYDDYTKNRIVATYMFGGEKLARKYTKFRKGNPKVNQIILEGVLANCKAHREHIKKQQIMTIEEWIVRQSI